LFESNQPQLKAMVEYCQEGDDSCIIESAYSIKMIIASVLTIASILIFLLPKLFGYPYMLIINLLDLLRVLRKVQDLTKVFKNEAECDRKIRVNNNGNDTTVKQKIMREQIPPWSMITEWKGRVKATPTHYFLRFSDAPNRLYGTLTYKTADELRLLFAKVLFHTYFKLDKGNLTEDAKAHMAEAPEALQKLMASDDDVTGFLKMVQDSVTEPEMDAYSQKVVPILVSTCPEYVPLWLAVMTLGKASSLINTNLVGVGLIHAIRTALAIGTDEHGKAKKRIVIVGSEFMNRFEGFTDELAELNVILVEYSGNGPLSDSISNSKTSDDIESLDNLLITKFSTESDETDLPHTLLAGVEYNTNWKKPMVYIYTSGTTGGLPKAVPISHLRFWSAGTLMKVMCHMSPADVVYCALPLYHSAGGMMGTSSCILAGSELVIRRKFTASGLYQELIEWDVTVLQYIGEFGRYAVAAASKNNQDLVDSSAKKPRVRVAYGNGLRPEIWTQFQTLFNIKHIVEFYGSTEGNANLVNNTGVVGAIGVVPRLLDFVYPVRLAKCDLETGELVRNEKGLVELVTASNEPGQLLGLMNDSDPSRRFDGYSDEKATKSKTINNVVQKGDSWFATGDLLKRNRFGFYFWVDRIGDTYRWKGENVSTSEVCEVLNKNESWALGFIEDSNVYGVELPTMEGRVGMARLTLKSNASFDDMAVLTSSGTERKSSWTQALFSELTAQLPFYAVPLFVRIKAKRTESNEAGDDIMTGTFKHKKFGLRQEGYDIGKDKEDLVLFRDDKAQDYVLLNDELLNELQKGTLKV